MKTKMRMKKKKSEWEKKRHSSGCNGGGYCGHWPQKCHSLSSSDFVPPRNKCQIPDVLIIIWTLFSPFLPQSKIRTKDRILATWRTDYENWQVANCERAPRSSKVEGGRQRTQNRGVRRLKELRGVRTLTVEGGWKESKNKREPSRGVADFELWELRASEQNFF